MSAGSAKGRLKSGAAAALMREANEAIAGCLREAGARSAPEKRSCSKLQLTGLWLAEEDRRAVQRFARRCLSLDGPYGEVKRHG